MSGIRYNKASVADACRAAIVACERCLKRGEWHTMRYVFPTAFGFQISTRRPPGMRRFYMVNAVGAITYSDDGAEKIVHAGGQS